MFVFGLPVTASLTHNSVTFNKVFIYYTSEGVWSPQWVLSCAAERFFSPVALRSPCHPFYKMLCWPLFPSSLALSQLCGFGKANTMATSPGFSSSTLECWSANWGNVSDGPCGNLNVSHICCPIDMRSSYELLFATFDFRGKYSLPSKTCSCLPLRSLVSLFGVLFCLQRFCHLFS